MHNSKKKVVGIITFLYTNYGGLLQGYALQKYLKDENSFDVFNINFRTEWHEKDARVFNLYGSFKSKIGQIAFTLLRFNGLLKRKLRTEKFKRDHFNLTLVYRTADEFISNPPIMDIYVSGSDQVFNPNGNYKDVFYLNFTKGKKRKVAYSASFGICDFNQDDTEQIAPLINDFDALSCREKEGSEYLSSISGKEVQWTVDPTLLLTADEWTQIAIAPKIKDKYIFIYALASESYLIDIARKIKEETGYKIFCVRSNTRDFYSIDKFIYGCGPSEFLGLVKNAEYVVTDSFHGTIFSTIFDKPFYVFISRPKVSTRIYNLIELLKVPERIITHESFNSFQFNNNLPLPNKKKLNQMTNDSKDFIKKEIIDAVT